MGRLLTLIFLYTLLSCQTEDEDIIAPDTYTIPYTTEASLTSFSFLKADNTGLTADVDATISGTNISVDLPQGVSPDKLVATFTTSHPDAKLYIGSEEQEGQTAVIYAASGQVLKVESELGRGTSYRLEVNPTFTELDDALNMLMQRHNIPGLSVAITKNEKLVHVQSYGYADKEANLLVDDHSLFRIGSLSKPITSIAVLKLIQEGILSFPDKVFGPEGILKDDYPAPPANSEIDKITVEDLIRHKSGWTNEPRDPMFSNASLTAKEIITDVVLHQQLSFTPGSTYYYSNLGYAILGRIIEKVTGKSYADFVAEAVLQPAGIAHMQLAGSTLHDRVPAEVTYYQQEVSPYAFNMARMDAHGGWIATATDLMRFMTLVDRNFLVPDLINSQLLENTYFGYNTWSHYGSLPGTTAVLTRLNDEFSFTVLANTRNNELPHQVAEELNNTLKEMILAKEHWPETDLFQNALLAENQQLP
ncbi:serine hydrolase domain-containing protein [Pontibacter korlensis]|uniref:serine hydrolase domain-containing protein n=1 Tax=Pontibacter korlensis TaxID=400092 RepID=UPI00130E2607|nr:serine hydrolase domain-containing protein [Pontibacter korlensis]